MCGKSDKDIRIYDLKIIYELDSKNRIDGLAYEICKDCWKKIKELFKSSVINWEKGDSPNLREAKKITEKATKKEIEKGL